MSNRISTIIISLTVLIAPHTTNAGALLYDNGSFITAFDVSNCLGLSQPQDVSFPVNGNATLGVQSDWFSQRVIDDFVVPPGESWDIETLRWRAYQSGTLQDASYSTAYLRLWTTDPLLGGEPAFGDFFNNVIENTFFTDVHRTGPLSQQGCARAIKNVDVDMTHVPSLPPGHYWIEVGFDSDLPNSIQSPPTEPRLLTDNAIQIDFSGMASAAVDAGTFQPLEFPFQLIGESSPTVPLRACVLPNGTCVDSTETDCATVHAGEWNPLYPCGELGACCDRADGTCRDHVQPQDCVGVTEAFSVGTPCSGVPSCGLFLGACCTNDGVTSTCQSFTNGINCAAMGGIWTPGSCAGTSCNDKCAAPEPVFDGNNPLDNFGYTEDYATTPNNCDNDFFVGNADAWFVYESTLANLGGTIEFSLCFNTTFDTTLQVYLNNGGSICDDPGQLAGAAYCDNDGCGDVGGGSYLVVPANPGDRFLVRIGGYAGAEGGGSLRITPIESGFGACCSVTGVCEMKTDSDCLSEFAAFFPETRCDSPLFACPPVGACCFGFEGCDQEFEHLCDQAGGTFLGEGSACVSQDDCDGDGQTDQCAIVHGAADCNANGVPDSCDILITESSTDCNFNAVPDECEEQAFCCPGDVNGDAYLDGNDIQAFVDSFQFTPPLCFSREFCRLDVNGDYSFDLGDIGPFVDRLLNPEPCPVLIHVSGQVNVLNEQGELIDVENRVFLFDEQGNRVSSYVQIAGAAQDSFGYRDGASDGQFVYFGWGGGLARHNGDGSNGILYIAGPTPGTEVTWRAIAYDPTGDGGNGSFWTQSFTSDLIESTRFGVLLNRFPNDFNLYGLAFDRETDMLWGHDLDADASAQIVQIDPATGLGTGVLFPSHFDVPGGSAVGLGQYGGLSFDPRTGKLYGLLQAFPTDAIFHCDTNGTLIDSLVPNPREDINDQTGTIRNLGITVSRP